MHPYKKFLTLALSITLALSLTSCGKKDSTPDTADAKDQVETITTQAPEAPTSYDININEAGHALHGYDAVSYQSDSGPIMGSSEHSMELMGATWLFANAENLEKFKADPDSYMPSNGGYCTFGIVLQKKFDGDPQVFLNNDGALHLFLNEEVREKFTQDTEGNLQTVSNNWKVIKDKSPAELE